MRPNQRQRARGHDQCRALSGSREPPGEASSRRVLSPLERISEALFGLIMVLTFTGSVSVAESGEADDDETDEDKIIRLMESRKMLPNASYFAFTATPVDHPHLRLLFIRAIGKEGKVFAIGTPPRGAV